MSGYRIDSTGQLDQCPTKGAALTWPVPIDSLLDDLRSTVERAGDRTTRRELAAAIVYAAPRTADELSSLLRSYRTAKVADIAGGAEGDGTVVEFRRHRPGPRSNRL